MINEAAVQKLANEFIPWFDEGDKPADWVGALGRRGIEVVRDIRRKEASAVLEEYARKAGVIYNPSRPGS